MAKILLVEDDAHAAEMAVAWLESERHVIDLARDGHEGLEHMRMVQYDLILLDWDLPGVSGIELLRQLRAQGNMTPVIMLTGKSQMDDKEQGFDGGADDYLTKPYSMKELSARIRALLRRAAGQPTNQLQLKGIVLVPDQLRVTRDGKDIDLLPREFSLLEFFMRNPNKVFSTEAIISRVWPTDTEASSNAFRSALKRLRQKLETEADTEPVIETVHGAGYRFNAS